MASITATHLNDDTSWLISFTRAEDETPFHLVVDPWFAGPQVDYFPLFSRQTHVVPPAYANLAELQAGLEHGQIDAILLTHGFTDHANEQELRTAPNKAIPVFGHPQAKARVDKWRIFDSEVIPFRVHSAKSDPLPDTLAGLAQRAKNPAAGHAPADVAVLYIPTDDWLDPAGNQLHGLTLLTFTVSAGADADQHTYSLLYSPHGLPTSSLSKTIAALDCLPSHTCLALLHTFDLITIPLMGKVNLGVQGSAEGIVKALKPKYYIRTHDELKTKEGLIGKVLQRKRETPESVQAYLGDVTQVRALESGESLQLL